MFISSQSLEWIIGQMTYEPLKKKMYDKMNRQEAQRIQEYSRCSVFTVVSHWENMLMRSLLSKIDIPGLNGSPFGCPFQVN